MKVLKSLELHVYTTGVASPELGVTFPTKGTFPANAQVSVLGVDVTVTEIAGSNGTKLLADNTALPPSVIKGNYIYLQDVVREIKSVDNGVITLNYKFPSTVTAQDLKVTRNPRAYKYLITSSGGTVNGAAIPAIGLAAENDNLLAAFAYDATAGAITIWSWE
jgi:hypothetical protein